MKRILALVLGLAACSPPTPDGPNVLIVLVDTLRADRLGAYGSERGLTPNLDRLASESLVFTDAWSTTSWTLPSMATLLTSNHGAQHGAWLAGIPLGGGIDTLPELFRDRGWRTAAFTGGGWVQSEFGLDRGFEVFEEDIEPIAEAVEKTKLAIAEDDGPWFVMLHTYEVHGPYAPPPEAAERVRAEHQTVLEELSVDPLSFQGIAAENGGVVPKDIVRAVEAMYDEEVRYADRVLGELFDWMRERGDLEDTLVVVTSDHGEEFGEHGVLGHSDSLYVEQLRIPWILRRPGAPAGEVDARPVSQIDFAPTVLDAAGLGSALSSASFVGVSLLSEKDPSPVYATRNHADAGLLQAFRDGAWVWIEGDYRWPRAERGSELYDLSRDPAQTANLAGDRADRAGELRTTCERLNERYGELRASYEEAAEMDDALREELQALGYL